MICNNCGEESSPLDSIIRCSKCGHLLASEDQQGISGQSHHYSTNEASGLFQELQDKYSNERTDGEENPTHEGVEKISTETEENLQQDDCHSALKEIRKKLLDLTRRNQLINFKHWKRMSLRIVDELPDQIVEELLTNAGMKFDPVPEPKREELVEAGYISIDPDTKEVIKLKKDPTPEEWAKHCNISTSLEVPQSQLEDEPLIRHQDNKIQTLLFPYQLESRLRGLTQKAQSAVQEMGTNILYLALGFLEWYESRDSEVKNHAPLFFLITLDSQLLRRPSANLKFLNESRSFQWPRIECNFRKA